MATSVLNRITVLDNDYCSLWYYPEKKIVHHKIKKFIFGEEFYKMLLAGTDLIKEHHATKWMSDDRGIPVLRKEDIDWGAANWFPKTAQAGWKWWAIMIPEQPLGKMNMEELAKFYGTFGITSRFFTDMDEAFRWLESCR